MRPLLFARNIIVQLVCRPVARGGVGGSGGRGVGGGGRTTPPPVAHP